MARELSNIQVVIEGSDSTPSTCDLSYQVANEDLNEAFEMYNEASPNFNQTVTALGTAIGTTVKTAENIT